MNHRKTTKKCGFSLVEFAIVMLIGTSLMIGAMKLYRSHIENYKWNQTDEKIKNIAAAIRQYQSIWGRYPCPASLTANMNDPDFAEGLNNPAETACDVGTIPLNTCVNGICRVEGARDVDGDMILEEILIGAVPFKEFSKPIPFLIGPFTTDYKSLFFDISIEDTQDSWGNKLTYIVTRDLTNSGAFASNEGAISVQTETGIELTNLAGGVHFIVLSHGPDMKGAHTFAGGAQYPCAGAGYDLENCDFTSDAVYLAGLRSNAPGATFYDDNIRFNYWTLSNIWRTSSSNPNEIYNLNPGNVGIGTDTPIQKLDIAGHASGDRMSSDMFCDQNGLYCFRPDSLGSSSGIGCAVNEVMNGISYDSANCTPLAPAAVSSDFNCPSGEFIYGFTISGVPQCRTP